MAVVERVDKRHPSAQWLASLRERFPTEPYVEKALDRKLRLRSGPPYKPQTVEAVRERLDAFLRRQLADPFAVSDLKPLAGGTSKEQFSFRLAWRDEQGEPRDERLVLRIQPPHSPAETHRLREFQLMNALQDIVPVPRGLWIDVDGECFGNPALICTFSEGVTAPPGDALEGFRMFYGPRYRKLIAPHYIRHLAQVHAVDCATLDLSSFLMPTAGTTDGVIAQINWWARVWEEDSVEPEPLITLAAKWLRDNAPPIDKVSIVHGDYKSGNFLFSPDTGAITAMLDWEIAWLGDRHADLAYVLQPLYSERGENGEVLVCGLCTREEFLHEYERCYGQPVDMARLDYYEVLVRWRNAILTVGGGARGVIEQKTHNEAVLAWFIGGCSATLMDALHESLELRLGSLA